MKVLKLLILTSIITYSAARVVVGTQNEATKKKNKLQSKQEDDAEGVVVDPVIPVANIEVYEVTTNAATVSSAEDVSTEISSSSTSSESTEVPIVNEDDQNPINRYCKCTSFECDCCRDFSLPLVPIRGPGCANIRYLEGDRLSVGIKFGNRVLANRIVSGRKSTPICLPLPGGFTNFCGRIYGISKKNENFKACLGLELRADEDVEAALRVSCFDFGPRGLRVTEAEPIPAAPSDEDDDDDDDDDDLFGLGSDDDDDDGIFGDDESANEDDTPTGQSAGPSSSNNNDDDDDDDVDYTGLSLLSGDFLDDILGGDEDDDSSDQNRPVPARKVYKKKKVPVTESSIQNEVDSSLNDGEVEEDDTPLTRPIQRPIRGDDDDDDDEDDEDGGILGILDDLISDGDDDDESEEEQLEDEVSEEIVQNELNDDVEEVAEEVDDETVTGNVKDAELENYDDQALEETVIDDDEDGDDDDEDELDDEKPSTLSGLSLLGLRKFFSRFFH